MPHPRRIPVVLVIACGGLLAFGQALFNEYAYDSLIFIPWLAPLGWSGLSATVSPEAYGKATGALSWRPLGIVTFIVYDLALCRASPLMSHALNLFLHFLNALLLYRIVSRWQRASEEWSLPAAIACGIFLLHPLVSEVVLCAGFRFDLFAATALLSGTAFLLGGNSATPRRLIISALCLAIGLGYKEVAAAGVVLFPLVLILRDGKPMRLQAIAMCTVLLVVFAAFGAAWMFFRERDYPALYLGGSGRGIGMLNVAVAFAEIYLKLLIAPWPLRIDHAFQPVNSLQEFRAVRGLTITATAFTAMACTAVRNPLAMFGMAWMILTFAPVSQIVPVPEAIAERFWYLPMAGLALWAGGVSSAFQPFSSVARKGLVTFLVTLAALCICICARRAYQWRDNTSLNIANWEESQDYSVRGLENLGALYLLRAEKQARQGHLPAAAESYQSGRERLWKLLRLDPGHVDGLRLMALYHLAVNNQEEARRYALRALNRSPDDPAVRAAARACGLPVNGE